MNNKFSNCEFCVKIKNGDKDEYQCTHALGCLELVRLENLPHIQKIMYPKKYNS